MKFGQLLYGKNEEVFLLYTEAQVQHVAISLTGGMLTKKELKYLRARTNQEITNLIIKIDSSGIGK